MTSTSSHLYGSAVVLFFPFSCMYLLRQPLWYGRRSDIGKRCKRRFHVPCNPDRERTKVLTTGTVCRYAGSTSVTVYIYRYVCVYNTCRSFLIRSLYIGGAYLSVIGCEDGKRKSFYSEYHTAAFVHGLCHTKALLSKLLAFVL
jgi:hypothetical protein